GDPVREIELSTGTAKPAPLGLKVAIAVELLNPVVPRVGDIQESVAVDRNAPGIPKLPRLLAFRSPGPQQLRQEVSARVEFLDAMIAGIAYIDDIFLIHRDTCGALKIGRRGSKHPPQLDKIPRVIELLNPAVAGIDDVDIAVLVARQPEGGSSEFSALEKMRAA